MRAFDILCVAIVALSLGLVFVEGALVCLAGGVLASRRGAQAQAARRRRDGRALRAVSS